MIAEAAIREALDASHDPEKDIDRIFEQLSKDIMVKSAAESARVFQQPPAGSLFEACVEVVGRIDPDAENITRAVIQTLIDRTESPTTCAELTRILAGVV